LVNGRFSACRRTEGDCDAARQVAPVGCILRRSRRIPDLLPCLPSLRVRSVLRQLRAEPAVDGRDQPNVIGLETDLSASRRWPVGDLDALRARPQFLQAGHRCAMQLGRIGEVAFLERRSFHHQVVLDELYLLGVDYIAAHYYLLDAAVLGHLEDVESAGEIERHHLMAVSVNVLLHGLGPGQN